jgi:hypothetical protein
MEWSMDDHTKVSKKIPPYTSSHYSSLELFIKMLKFLKREKLSSKNKMVGRKNGEYFRNIPPLFFFFFFPHMEFSKLIN